jgi:hypothetical protein
MLYLVVYDATNPRPVTTTTTNGIYNLVNLEVFKPRAFHLLSDEAKGRVLQTARSTKMSIISLSKFNLPLNCQLPSMV